MSHSLTALIPCLFTFAHALSLLQVDTDFSNDLDVRTMLLVHDTRPPFLDGRMIFTKQAEPVLPLRDPTSDMAVIAKGGSKLVKEIREKKNEGKSRQRFWEVAGSKMGKITGTAQPTVTIDALRDCDGSQSLATPEQSYAGIGRHRQRSMLQRKALTNLS